MGRKACGNSIGNRGCAERLRNERKGAGRELFPSDERLGDMLSRQLK